MSKENNTFCPTCEGGYGKMGGGKRPVFCKEHEGERRRQKRYLDTIFGDPKKKED